MAITGGLIYKLKNLIRISFISCSFIFAPRVCNKVAHALVALVCKCPHDIVVLYPQTKHMLNTQKSIKSHYNLFYLARKFCRLKC